MKSNPDLPPGWAMPQDHANRLRRDLRKKSKPPEEELDDALRDLARDIAILEPDPLDWEGWVSIFLGHLNVEARQRKKFDSYQEMVNALITNLSGKDKSDPSQTI